MHELPFVQNLLRIALEHAEKAGAKRILALRLVIGQMSTIVDDAVQFYGTSSPRAPRPKERTPVGPATWTP